MEPVAPHSREPALARAVAIGLGAGLLSGLFGVGGGILIVPALVAALGFDRRLAHGTSLAAILPIAVAGLVSFGVAGNVDWWVGIWLTIGALGGAVVGTALLHRLPHTPLVLAFSALLAITIVRLLVTVEPGVRPDLTAGLGALLAIIGFASGVLAGLLGVGGGIILVPAMIILVGLAPVVAKGTSLAVIVPTAVVGTLRNRRHANADLRVAIAVGLAGMVTAAVGAVLAGLLSPTTSNLLLAALLVVVLVRQLRSLREGDR